jgi:hypothetical protein
MAWKEVIRLALHAALVAVAAAQVLCLYTLTCTFAQTTPMDNVGISNSGRIVNIGTMRVLGGKSFTSSATTATVINAAFQTDGILELSGATTTLSQPSLAGWTRFTHLASDASSVSRPQFIPLLTYAKLRFSNGSQVFSTSASQERQAVKLLERMPQHTQAASSLIVSDSLLIDSLVTVDIPTGRELQVQGLTSLARQSFVQGAGTMRLNGRRTQVLHGTGSVRELVVDNPNGVDVAPAERQSTTNAANTSMRVEECLVLERGELRNATSPITTQPALGNIALGDSALILRNAASALLAEPLFGRRVSVRYVGNESLVATGEIPSDSTRLSRLEILNAGGATLTRNTTVNTALVVASSLATGAFVLVLSPAASALDPVFLSDSSEIIGSFQRFITLRDAPSDTLPLLMHNRYTSLQFPFVRQNTNLTSLAAVRINITPDTPPAPDRNTNKIRRSIALSFLNAQLLPLDEAPAQVGLMRFNYAWRTRPRNETNSLETGRIVLQRWNGQTWLTAGVPLNPQQALQSGVWNQPAGNGLWFTGVADSVRLVSGNYALGLDSDVGLLPPITLNLRAVLEGAVRLPLTPDALSMHNDLQRSSLLPSPTAQRPLPAMYPFTLLGARRESVRASSLPDSVVDWVVVELRRSFAQRGDSTMVFPALLRRNGSLTDLNGSPLQVRRSVFEAPLQAHLVLHHRHHLAVISAERFTFTPNSTIQLDFTQPSSVLGGEDALKFLGVRGFAPVFALPVGDINSDGIINRSDYDAAAAPPPSLPSPAWLQMFSEGYTSADVTMDGLVTTLDMNYIWNNRNRSSRVPNAGGTQTQVSAQLLDQSSKQAPKQLPTQSSIQQPSPTTSLPTEER